MTTIEQAYAEVHRNAHITLFTAPPSTPANDAPAPFDVEVVMDAVRAAMLQAHSDACTQCLYRSQGAERAECAGYRRIEELR